MRAAVLIIWLPRAPRRGGPSSPHALKIPDGYFVLDLGQGRVRHCFIEFDNQTLTIAYAGESTKDFAHKIRTIAAFYRSGRYAQLFPEAGD